MYPFFLHADTKSGSELTIKIITHAQNKVGADYIYIPASYGRKNPAYADTHKIKWAIWCICDV
jgi:hypothetical protein